MFQNTEMITKESVFTISYKSVKQKKPILSVPLADYIDIGIFSEEEVDGKKNEVILYLKKHKITTINNKITIIVDKKPTELKELAFSA